MNGKENIKRQREQNWSESEKEMLRELVRGHLAIVDDKKNDIRMISAKKAAWIDIQKNMEVAGFNRGIPKLKDQWHRMKNAARKSVSTMRAAQRATGNKVVIKEPNEEELMVRDMLAEEFIEDEILIDSDTFEIEAKELKDDSMLHSISLNGKKEDELPSVVELEDGDISPIKKLRQLPKKHRTQAKDVLNQRRKQISREEQQSKELHKLRLTLLQNQIQQEKSLHTLEIKIKETMLETTKLQRDRETRNV